MSAWFAFIATGLIALTTFVYVLLTESRHSVTAAEEAQGDIADREFQLHRAAATAQQEHDELSPDFIAWLAEMGDLGHPDGCRKCAEMREAERAADLCWCGNLHAGEKCDHPSWADDWDEECRVCQWVAVRRLCDPEPYWVPTKRCDRHRGHPMTTTNPRLASVVWDLTRGS